MNTIKEWCDQCDLTWMGSFLFDFIITYINIVLLYTRKNWDLFYKKKPLFMFSRSQLTMWKSTFQITACYGYCVNGPPLTRKRYRLSRKSHPVSCHIWKENQGTNLKRDLISGIVFSNFSAIVLEIKWMAVSKRMAPGFLIYPRIDDRYSANDNPLLL